ncbi:single-stranded DNA-binding protein [Escherichia coli]
MPLAAKVLKKVMVNTGGNKRQVPAKRQNRGSETQKLPCLVKKIM